MTTLATPPAHPLEEIVRDLCYRLHEGIEQAAFARAQEIVQTILAAANGLTGSRSLKREMRLAASERRRVLGVLTRQFLREIELATKLLARQAVRDERSARARDAAAKRAASAAARASERRARRRPIRPPPPPPDPQQLKRDAETRRLRALLRPANEEFIPLPPASPAPPPPEPVAPPTTSPGSFLRTLEREIQEAVPLLGKLGPDRCGAQIAAWTGQVRQFRDQLPELTAATMRPAFRIFLEHLTELRTAMEASFVDALEPKWSPPSWEDYIEANRARAEGRRPAMSEQRLQAHHHAMLRALVKPHRRKVPEQAASVIAAAAESLPEDDGLLRSARRRHSANRRAQDKHDTDALALPPEDASLDLGLDETLDHDLDDAAKPLESDDALADASQERPIASDVCPEPAEDEAIAAPPATPTDTFPFPDSQQREPTSEAGESEFDQTWTK